MAGEHSRITRHYTKWSLSCIKPPLINAVLLTVKRGTRCPSKICEEAEIHGEPRNLSALWKYFRLGIPYLRV